MEILYVILAAASGYLIGSISNGRILTRLTAPGTDISKIEYTIPRTTEVFRSDSISASAVRMHVGTKQGVLTALLDMLKVGLPTLAFKLWYPEEPYFLIVAAFGLIGHDWPIYHHFRGGRGESPIYGGLIVIDWFGALAMNILGMALGFAIGHLLILRWAGLVLLIPWLWFTTGSYPHLAYIVFVNIIYWYTMSPELRQYFELEKKGVDPSQEEIAEFLGMGMGLGRALDRFGLIGLLRRIRGKTDGI